MKYYEINYPYYALLKAENQEETIKEYTNVVADNDIDNPLENEIKEVSHEYALVKFAKEALNKIPFKHPIPFILSDFRDENMKILLMDGSLV